MHQFQYHNILYQQKISFFTNILLENALSDDEEIKKKYSLPFNCFWNQYNKKASLFKARLSGILCVFRT